MRLDLRFVGLGMILSSIPFIAGNLPPWKLIVGLGVIVMIVGFILVRREV